MLSLLQIVFLHLLVLKYISCLRVCSPKKYLSTLKVERSQNVEPLKSRFGANLDSAT